MSTLLKAGHYIDGQWLSGAATYPVLNPATGETLAQVPRGGAEETQAAIAAAERALPAWRGKLAKERAQILRRWSELMLEQRDALATLLSREQASRWPKPRAKWPMQQAFSNGSPRKVDACTATSFLPPRPTRGCW